MPWELNTQRTPSISSLRRDAVWKDDSMIPEIGLYGLVLAFALASIQATIPIRVKARFHIGFNFLTAVIFVINCGASDAQVVRLAGPPESCRPVLTGQGGPVAWQVLLVHNRAALAERSQVAVDNRFPICIVDAVKAHDVELGVSFTPIAGK